MSIRVFVSVANIGIITTSTGARGGRHFCGAPRRGPDRRARPEPAPQRIRSIRMNTAVPLNLHRFRSTPIYFDESIIIVLCRLRRHLQRFQNENCEENWSREAGKCIFINIVQGQEMDDLSV
jgi:hypothetical protein